MLETYFMEHVKKTDDVDNFFYSLCFYCFAHGDPKRMESLFERIIE